MIARFVSIRTRIACASVIFAVWFGLPFLIMRVDAVEIRGPEIIIARTFPLDALGLPRPMISVHQSVRRLEVRGEESRPCIDSSYVRYSDPAPVVRRDLDRWATRCRVQPYRWEGMWTIWLGGIVPLRPITREILVLDPPNGATD